MPPPPPRTSDASDETEPRRLVDPTTGRPVLMAPVRKHRPMHTGTATKNRSSCPFCPGQEHQTPPEIDRCGGEVWTARAFANKYPAHRHHEVIAEGGPHREQPADLPTTDWREVIELWQRRIRTLEERSDVGCAFLFKNVGARAGASIAHNHSQLLGLSSPPPRLLTEASRAADLEECPWCASLRTAEAEGRLVLATEHHVALVPAPPKLPYEVWLLPRVCGADFLTTDPDELADAVHGLFSAVANALDRPPFNFWLHRLPSKAGLLHWHFELQPRTGQLAGLELGGDMYINSFSAAESATTLRRGIPD